MSRFKMTQLPGDGQTIFHVINTAEDRTIASYGTKTFGSNARKCATFCRDTHNSAARRRAEYQPEPSLFAKPEGGAA